jgi:hypothetical protein
MKKRRFDQKRALRHELDLGVNAALVMGDGSMNQVASEFKDDPRNQILYAFGDCVMGRGDKKKIQTYSSSYRYLVKKLRSLGHKVVFYSEPFTSQRFPITGTQMEASGWNQV